jgi:hypothetical protein
MFCPSTVLLVNLHKDCQPFTTVEKQRPRSGLRFSLNPRTAAVLDAILPPLGCKHPPPSLIGSNMVTNGHHLLRAKNQYAHAYKPITIQDWNAFIAFGIEQFNSLAKYFAQCKIETPERKNLRLVRYYR